MKRFLFGIAAAFVTVSAWAQAGTPAGLWKTIDDETQKEKSLVRIVDTNGTLSGKVEKFLDPATAADLKCEKCTDDRKGQPVLGMTIVRDLKKSPDSDNRWEGGTVLDPNNGKAYKARITLIDGGRKLELRGYIGAPIFGRTQTWIRVE